MRIPLIGGPRNKASATTKNRTPSFLNSSSNFITLATTEYPWIQFEASHDKVTCPLNRPPTHPSSSSAPLALPLPKHLHQPNSTQHPSSQLPHPRDSQFLLEALQPPPFPPPPTKKRLSRRPSSAKNISSNNTHRCSTLLKRNISKLEKS